MALYSVSAGGTILAADIDQYFNRLTGVTTDQQTVLKYVTTTLATAGMTLALQRVTPSTDVQGIVLSGGVATDTLIYREANDDSLWFGYWTGTALGYVLRLGMGSGSPQTNGATSVNVDPNNGNSGTQSYWLQFGNSSAEGISSKRSAGGNQSGLDFWTGGAIHAALSNAGLVFLGGSSNSAALAIRPDASTTDPGTGAWTRTDGGGGLVVNPHGTGQLYFCWDVANAAHFGGSLAVSGVTTVNAGLNVPDAQGLLFGAQAALIVEFGTFTVSYTGSSNPQTFGSLALKNNFHGRTPSLIAQAVAGSPQTTQCMASANSTNQATLVITSPTNTSITFNYIAVG